MPDRPIHIIRPAMRHELPEVSVIIASALRAFRGDVPDRVLHRYIAYSADIRRQADRGDIVVLESEGRIAGGVVYYANAGAQDLGLPDGWAAMRTLAVHPKARSRGFGRSLVDYCIARARTDGAKTVGLHTADFMRVAVAIYRNAGFKRAPEHDLKASGIFDLDPENGDVLVTAYRLELYPRRAC